MTYKHRISIATKAIELSNDLNLFDFMDSQEKTQNINDIYNNILYTDIDYIKGMIKALKDTMEETSDISKSTMILFQYVITELLLLTYGY